MARRIYIDPDDIFKSRNEGGGDLTWYLIQKLLENNKKDEKKDDKKPEKKPATGGALELMMLLNLIAFIVGPIYWHYLAKVIH